MRRQRSSAARRLRAAGLAADGSGGAVGNGRGRGGKLVRCAGRARGGSTTVDADSARTGAGAAGAGRLSATLTGSPDLPARQAAGFIDQLRMGEMVNYRDTLAQTGIVAFLAQHNKAYALELSTQASYPDLQRGASVLVGGLDNVWTMRVTAPLRYHFVRRGVSFVYAIEDREHPELQADGPDMAQMPDRGTEDFALVARIFDQTTGRPVLVVAGLGANGTNAAAQFLLDPARTAELTAHAPRDWQHLNMEAVLRTQIIDNHAGPPHLVACTFW